MQWNSFRDLVCIFDFTTYHHLNLLIDNANLYYFSALPNDCETALKTLAGKPFLNSKNKIRLQQARPKVQKTTDEKEQVQDLMDKRKKKQSAVKRNRVIVKNLPYSVCQTDFPSHCQGNQRSIGNDVFCIWSS